MKRLLALLAAAALLGATPPDNYNAFGIAILQRLAAQAHDRNVFISPLSLGVALAMAAEGATGKTRAQMLRTLGVSDANLAQANAALLTSLGTNHDARVGVANAIWLRRDLRPRPQYVLLLEREYRAHAQALHFGDPSAAKAINAWTSQHSLGLIPQLVARTTANDYAYLTDALAFQADWTAPFAKSATQPRSFTDAAGTVRTVPMMSQVGNFFTGAASSYRALRLPYGQGGYAAYILLPNGRNARGVIANMTPASFEASVRSLRDEYLRMELPRFTARYDASLVNLLRSMGMRSPFSGTPDFYPMCGCRPGTITITSVLHKTYVHVDERGTVAAAATAIQMTYRAASRPLPRPPTFIVNHPFILALRDEHSGALLFIGVINSITQ